MGKEDFKKITIAAAATCVALLLLSLFFFPKNEKYEFDPSAERIFLEKNQESTTALVPISQRALKELPPFFYFSTLNLALSSHQTPSETEKQLLLQELNKDPSLTSLRTYSDRLVKKL